MYGEEYGSVMGKGVCSRCDSTTRLRGLQKVGTDIIVCHAICNKCHFTQFIGFTSVQEVAHAVVKQKLQKLLDAADNPVAKKKITKKIEYLDAKKRLSDLGL